MAIFKLHVYPSSDAGQTIRDNANESDSGATAFTFGASDFIKVRNVGNLKLFIDIGATSTGFTIFTTKKVAGLDVADRVVSASTNTLHAFTNLDADLYNEQDDSLTSRSSSGGEVDDGYLAIQLTQPANVKILSLIHI